MIILWDVISFGGKRAQKDALCNSNSIVSERPLFPPGLNFQLHSILYVSFSYFIFSPMHLNYLTYNVFYLFIMLLSVSSTRIQTSRRALVCFAYC